MLDIALNEWAVVCDALVAGEQSILLRKGGIEEADGPGRFRLATPRFALFPAWLHQRPERIQPPWRDRVKLYDHELSELTVAGIGVAERVWQVPSRESLEALDDLHIWTADQLDMRWNYKPHQPLYLLAVRVFRLPEPKTITNNPTYAGCKSWVDLDAADAVDDAMATPVIGDSGFAELVDRIDAALTHSP